MEVVKIKLNPGDTPSRVMSVLGGLKGQEIYCELSSKFVLITQQDFLKKLKNLFAEDLDKLTFVTQKTFFTELLEKQGFKVISEYPESISDEPVKVIRDFLDRVEAIKNVEEETKEVKVEMLNPDMEKSSSKIKANFTKRKIENLAREKSWRGLVFFLFLGLIGGLAALFFFISPRAEIVVKPRIDTIEITQNVIVALPGAQIPEEESQLPVVPAILVDTEIAGTETFASTRKEYEMTNAQGKITLFNADKEAKFLVPSRLMTDEGLVFRTQQNVTIPGATDDGPGALEVAIIADEYDIQERPIGDRGNVENGTNFFFPALREELQALYYAKADRGPLVGGSTLTRYFVAEDDAELAKNVLEESFRVRGIEALRTEISERSQREDKSYILLDRANLVQAQMQEFIFPEDIVGQEQSTFEVQARYSISGVVFDQDTVIDHLQKKLRLNQDERKKIVDVDASTVDYRLLTTDQLTDGGWVKTSVSIIGVETIDFEANNLFAKKWQDSIKREVTGKELPQARGILVNHPEVEEVIALKISPFWNKVVPTILDRIDLKIKY